MENYPDTQYNNLESEINNAHKFDNAENTNWRNRRRGIFSSEPISNKCCFKSLTILLAFIEIIQVIGYYLYWIYDNSEPDLPFKNVKYFLFLFFAPFLLIYFFPSCLRKLIILLYLILFFLKMSIIKTMGEIVLIWIFTIFIIVESVTIFILIF
jgi:hypothetical protein